MSDIGGIEVVSTGSRLLTAEDVTEVTAHIERLESENAKLRKQLIDLKCAPCCGDSCWLHLPERLRELGVEVDG